MCIEAALYLLDKAELSEGARSNPVHVIRTMSQMVCFCVDFAASFHMSRLLARAAVVGVP